MNEKFLSMKGDDRGITGIGVLILFIALVLVAAIASGVILDTAGFLQNRASDTGTDSTNQVSNQVQVLAVTGDVASDAADGIDALRVNVFKSPGAADIDLDGATIQYVAPDGSAVLTLDSANTTADNGSAAYDVSAYRDTDGSAPVLNAEDDRFEILINLTDSTGTAPDTAMTNLVASESATPRNTSASGSTTTYIINVPDSLSSSTDSSILL